MAVTVNIPGFGEVSAQNAAQDDTLNRIASILTDIASKQGAKVSTGSIKALNLASQKAAMSTRRAADSVDNLGDSSGAASSSIYGLASTAKTVKSAFAQASSGLSSGKDTFGSGFDIMADMLRSGGDAMQSALADVPVASILGGLAGASAAAAAAILANISVTAKSFQALQQAGGSFGYSLLAVRDHANDAGLRLDQFQNVFAKNAKVFAAFGGSTAQGAKDFARLNLMVRDGRKGFAGVGRDLLRMGIGFEEQAEGVAESLQQFKLDGYSMENMSRLAAPVQKYQLIQARQLKVLAQLNGTTLEQEKAKQKSMREDATTRMILSKYTGEDRLKVDAAMKQAESLMVGGGKLFLQQMESGGPMTEGMAMMAMQYPEFAKQTGLMAQGIKGGRLSLEETSTFMARNMSEAAHAADSQRVGATAGVLALAEVNGGYVDSAKKLFVHADDLGMALGNVTKIFTDLDKLSEPAESYTKTMLAALETQQKVTTEMSSIMTDIASSALTQDLLLGPMEQFLEWLTNFAEDTGTLSDIMVGPDSLGAATEHLRDMFNTLVPDFLQDAFRALSPAESNALGGPINAGESTIVGELGPELITPSQSGFVNSNNKFAAMIQTSMRDAMKKYGTTASPADQFTSMMPDMQKMMAEMTKYGTTVSQDTSQLAETNTQKLLTSPPAGVDDNLRKRQVEDAMLALPGLLMENIKAVNQVSQLTAELPHELQAVIA